MFNCQVGQRAENPVYHRFHLCLDFNRRGREIFLKCPAWYFPFTWPISKVRAAHVYINTSWCQCRWVHSRWKNDRASGARYARVKANCLVFHYHYFIYANEFYSFSTASRFLANSHVLLSNRETKPSGITKDNEDGAFLRTLVSNLKVIS